MTLLDVAAAFITDVSRYARLDKTHEGEAD